jgi:hypothetical protein
MENLHSYSIEDSSEARLFSHCSDNLLSDSNIWDSLKQAISNSSGFQRWQLEGMLNDRLRGMNLDTLVRHYLRETLETLAY